MKATIVSLQYQRYLFLRKEITRCYNKYLTEYKVCKFLKLKEKK